jgi:hypothetical protein
VRRGGVDGAGEQFQCGWGWVSGTPGDSIRAENFDQSAVAGSTTASPSDRALPRDASFSSHRATLAPPAIRARAAVRPVRPRPNTATVLPSKPRTGITWRPLPYRILRVARPTSASTTATIQKRITTVDSRQPSFSKWWWIGAIRKMRRPVVLK